MSTASSVSPFDDWWARLLHRDAAQQVEVLDRAPWTVLRCVFCDRDLEPTIRDQALGREGGRDEMIAYWQRPGDCGGPIVAAGLYCVGRDHCLGFAEKIGILHDWHATHYTGLRAMPLLERVVAGYPRWEPLALRRLTLTFAALGRLPAPRRTRAGAA